LCPGALNAPVGQEGIGEAHQRPVCHGGPGGTVLVLAQPEQLLTVCADRLHSPACFVRPNAPGGGECRGLGHASKKLPGRPLTREDAMPRAAVADRPPPGIHTAGTDVPMGLRDDARCGTPPPPQVPAVAAGFALPARLAEAPMALARGGQVAPCARQACTPVRHQESASNQTMTVTPAGGGNSRLSWAAIAVVLRQGHPKAGPGSCLTSRRMPWGSTGWRRTSRPPPY
jgi:hypothetical protein